MSKKWRVALIMLAIMAFSVLISACGEGSNASNNNNQTTQSNDGCATGSITISGSTALQPLVQEVAKKYQAKCSGSSITVNGGGSKTGLAQVTAGNVNIGNSDVFANEEQAKVLTDHQVAAVIFSIIVNPKVNVKNLTTQQVKDIYTGKVTNWKEVGGADMKIVVVSRPASSGTRASFQQFVLGGPESVTGPQNLTTDSTGQVIQNVAQNEGAIGYASVGSIKDDKVVKVSLDGKEPTAENIKNNDYKFWNIEHMYTKGEPQGLAKSFLDYMVSDEAKEVATAKGFVQLKELSQDAISSHQQKK
ncbi:phosphate ABC transporter substrate-binding protein (PhoT family) [Thermosporothrix hazakensis]|jgi:phosphate transport system substrate-binding protein|uniref:Phosphate-binding protein n=2 Tax=Thermosporothrix TaxID=768650 RepID=A0A326TV12_THEHA|nr:phosphate ABC transporter substrate-binding protein [Thermosporothrix hazakensis]PZW19205.1 phosphate ABC transporter substrate-binding protein (PhoT family) [Thermosporothrix hazakensis]BBH89711.1 phosphate-binding protein [Thermosporothrix sp. COM3]GCE47898.1 phosphate-binding protein [Thermosporothrix hazakensis]